MFPPPFDAAAIGMPDLKFHFDTWTTLQGNPAIWLEYRIVDNNINMEIYARTYFVVIGDSIYYLSYLVNQNTVAIEVYGTSPDNYHLYLKNRIEPMVNSLCFPINNGKPCTDTTNPPPPPPTTEPETIVTEEWINTNYKQNPNFGLIYKITLSCNDPIDGIFCKDQPTKIREVHVFAGSTCITNPSTCDSGTKDQDIVIPKPTVFFPGAPTPIIPQDILRWSAFRNTNEPFWDLFAYSNSGTPDIFKVDAIFYSAFGSSVGQSDVLSLAKTTTCDKKNVCQEKLGPASPPSGTIYGPYQPIVGPDFHTGIIVKPGDLVRTFATGLVDFGGARNVIQLVLLFNNTVCYSYNSNEFIIIIIHITNVGIL